MARRIPDSNYRGQVALTPESAKSLRQALKELEKAVRREVLDDALLEGAELIHDAAESRAPGPHIEVEVMGGRAVLTNFRFYRESHLVTANTRFAVIGPDDDHWYYRFFEFGAVKHNISITKPGMVAFDGIVRAYARRTGGVKKKPFLRPAIDSQGQAAVDAMAAKLRSNIEKAAKA